ncbi:MAG: hypothetical protein KDB03_20775, partial [Planctomycetales bacterium]|nr:hypothetical protein [Planctomycetales bacterium]
NVPTRNVSEGFLFGPSLTLRVKIGRFISAARLKLYDHAFYRIFHSSLAAREREGRVAEKGQVRIWNF